MYFQDELVLKSQHWNIIYTHSNVISLSASVGLCMSKTFPVWSLVSQLQSWSFELSNLEIWVTLFFPFRQAGKKDVWYRHDPLTVDKEWGCC